MVALEGLGCALLILAPGNFVRTSVLPEGLMSLMYRVHGQVNALCNWLFPSLLLLLVSFYLLSRIKVRPSKISLQFIALATLSDLVMIASPSYPQRARFGVFVFILIAFINNLYTLLGAKINKEDSKAFKIISMIIFVSFIMTMISLAAVLLARNIGFNIPS